MQIHPHYSLKMANRKSTPAANQENNRMAMYEGGPKVEISTASQCCSNLRLELITCKLQEGLHKHLWKSWPETLWQPEISSLAVAKSAQRARLHGRRTFNLTTDSPVTPGQDSKRILAFDNPKAIVHCRLERMKTLHVCLHDFDEQDSGGPEKTK